MRNMRINGIKFYIVKISNDESSRPLKYLAFIESNITIMVESNVSGSIWLLTCSTLGINQVLIAKIEDALVSHEAILKAAITYCFNKVKAINTVFEQYMTPE